MSEQTTIPFRFLTPNAPLIMVPAHVNGAGPYDFILDTGNASMPIILSTALAAELGIQGTEVDSGFTVELHQSFEKGQVDSFALGDLKVGPLEMAAGSALDQLGEKLGVTVHGNIGYPFLRDYALTLDFENSTLTLSKEGPEGPFVEMAVTDQAPLIMIDVHANGKPLRFALDTGASACCLSYEAAEAIGIDLGEGMALNRAERVNSHRGVIEELRVGDKSQRCVKVAVAEFFTELNAAAGVTIDGVLGLNFWRAYRLTIDYPRRRVFFGEGL